MKLKHFNYFVIYLLKLMEKDIDDTKAHIFLIKNRTQQIEYIQTMAICLLWILLFFLSTRN